LCKKLHPEYYNNNNNNTKKLIIDWTCNLIFLILTYPKRIISKPISCSIFSYFPEIWNQVDPYMSSVDTIPKWRYTHSLLSSPKIVKDVLRRCEPQESLDAVKSFSVPQRLLIPFRDVDIPMLQHISILNRKLVNNNVFPLCNIPNWIIRVFKKNIYFERWVTLKLKLEIFH